MKGNCQGGNYINETKIYQMLGLIVNFMENLTLKLPPGAIQDLILSAAKALHL